MQRERRTVDLRHARTTHTRDSPADWLEETGVKRIRSSQQCPQGVGAWGIGGYAAPLPLHRSLTGVFCLTA